MKKELQICFEYASIKDLLGKILVEIVGMEDGSDSVEFVTDEGERFLMYHEQDCCEQVWLEDVCGDPKDLIGGPILCAYEEDNVDDPEDFDGNSYECYEWTFYVLGAMNGRVTLRWLGSSNGYYSTAVTFRKTKKLVEVW